MRKVSIMQKQSNNTNSLAPILSPQAASSEPTIKLNLVDDSCDCRNCQAILFLPFNGKQIPISQSDYDEIFFYGYKSLFPPYKIIPYSRYVNFK